MSRRRWPKWVYGVGTEPDARFTLANERTFLAWIRTSLALMAGGVAVEALGQPGHGLLRNGLSLLLLATGTICAVGGFVRWAKVERSMRTGAPLPGPMLLPLLAFGLTVAGLLAVLLLVSQ